MNPRRLPPALMLLTLVLVMVPASVNAQPRPSAAEMAAPIVAWTNAARMQKGKGPLRVNEELTRAALQHARNMASQEVMAHTLDDLTLEDRVRRVGYRHAGCGENIAFVGGYAYPAWALFDSWMRSEGHYKNIMNDQFTEIGVGVACSSTGKFYACQVFARPEDAPQFVPMPTSAPAPRMIPYSSQRPTPTMPYLPNTGSAGYQRPPYSSQLMAPYSPYTGAPGWTRSYSRPLPQPVDDFHWYVPWEWR